MNKAQFVELVQKSGGYKTKVEAETAIKAFTDAVTEALVAKEEVSLVGFGSFKAVPQAAKSGSVPGKPGQTYSKPATTIPKFSAGKGLKDSVASGQ
ncbi:MAG: HU family DNA-binding protein [Paludibacter sp.]|nr:HU family DNA-binding protein [Paludibacter sp.]